MLSIFSISNKKTTGGAVEFKTRSNIKLRRVSSIDMPVPSDAIPALKSIVDKFLTDYWSLHAKLEENKHAPAAPKCLYQLRSTAQIIFQNIADDKQDVTYKITHQLTTELSFIGKEQESQSITDLKALLTLTLQNNGASKENQKSIKDFACKILTECDFPQQLNKMTQMTGSLTEFTNWGLRENNTENLAKLHGCMQTICDMLHHCSLADEHTQKLTNFANEFITTLNSRALSHKHQSLITQNQSELVRQYFERAIAATTLTDHGELPYHLDDIDLIKQDVTFIINNIDALTGQENIDINGYNRLLFGTCEKISKLTNDDGAFIKEKYDQLLDVKTNSGQTKIYLLSPFKNWLDSNGIERRHYSINQRTYSFHFFDLAITRRDDIDPALQANWR